MTTIAPAGGAVRVAVARSAERRTEHVGAHRLPEAALAGALAGLP